MALRRILSHWAPGSLFDALEPDLRAHFQVWRSSMVRIILLLTLVLYPGRVLFALLGPRDELPRIAITYAALWLFSLLCFVLNQRGRYGLAAGLLVYCGWAAQTLIAFTTHGVAAPAYGAFLLNVFFAGLLLGSRTALVVTLLAIGSGLSMWAAEVYGLRSFQSEHTTFTLLVAEILKLIVAFAILLTSQYGLRTALRVISDSEQQLRVSERRFRTLVDNAPEAIVVLDATTMRFVDANEHALRLFGIARTALTTVGVLDLSPPLQEDGSPSADLARTHIEAALAGSAPAFEWMHRTTSGSMIPCEVRLVRLPSEDQQLVRGSLTEITERRLAEQNRLALERRNEEWRFAHRVQTAFLPKAYDNPYFDIAATMQPADDVGGDYLDLIERADGTLWFAIGDVSGHGLTSGLVALTVRSTLHTLLEVRPDLCPSEAMELLSSRLSADVRLMDHHLFMTMSLFCTRDGNSILYSGLHLPALLHRHRTGRVEWLDTDGRWIGMDRHAALVMNEPQVDSEVTIERGDTLLLYSDGIPEAFGSGDELYSYERLSETFGRQIRLSVTALHAALLADVKDFMTDQRDDMTLMVLRRK